MHVKLYSKYTWKISDKLVTCNETRVYLFERKRKSSNRIWAPKNAKRHNIDKRLRTVRYKLFSLTLKARSCKFQKDKMDTNNFLKNVVIKKLKKYYNIRHPKTSSKYYQVSHDNARAHKTRILTKYLEAENLTKLSQTLFPKI